MYIDLCTPETSRISVIEMDFFSSTSSRLEKKAPNYINLHFEVIKSDRMG